MQNFQWEKISRQWARALAVFCALCLAACGAGGSGALPQASIPNDNSGGITISTPNSEGFVTVAGTSATVPASAIVIIDIDPASAKINLEQMLDGLIPSAAAASCVSELPTCPVVDSEQRCQFPADTNGAFTLQIPATLTDRIDINYLDPDSCNEIDDFFDGEIPDTLEEAGGFSGVQADTIALTLDAYAISRNEDANLLYIFGTVGSSLILQTLSLDTNELIDTLDLSTYISGTPENINFGTTPQGLAYLQIKSDAGNLLISTDSNGIPQTTTARHFLASSSSSNLPPIMLHSAYSYTITAGDLATFTVSPSSCPAQSYDSNTALSASDFAADTTYTRGIFRRNASIYIVDDLDGNIPDSLFSGHYYPRVAYLQFSSSGSTLTNSDIYHISTIGTSTDALFMLATTTDGSLYYFKTALDNLTICSMSISIEVVVGISNSQVVAEANTLDILDSDGTTHTHLFALTTDDSIYDIDTFDDTVTEIYDASSPPSFMSLTDIADLQPVFRSPSGDTAADLLLIGTPLSSAADAAEFMAIGGVESPLTAFTDLNPTSYQGHEYDSNNELVYVLDQGSADDDASTLVLYHFIYY